MPGYKEVSAETLYNVYCESVEWKNYKGDPLPKYHELQANRKNGWEDVSSYVEDIISR